MRIKVELHKEVIRYLRRECDDEERRAFYYELRRVEEDAIGNSEAISDPTLSRYILRFFRFEGNIAIFQTNRARDRLKVERCQRSTRQKISGGEPNEEG